MQFSWLFPLLLMLVAVMSEREVNERKDKILDPYFYMDRRDQLFEDEKERNEKTYTSETELLPEDYNPGKGDSDGDIDSCLNYECESGKECRINEEGRAHCTCVKACPEEVDEKNSVCSNLNETWNSECELYQMRCMCMEDLDGCVSDMYKDLEMDYFGPCKDLGECTKGQLADFPHRLREWFYIIMQQSPGRKQQDEDSLLPLKETGDSQADRKWVGAVLWKFCDLDAEPRDRSLSSDELFPLRGPLVSMEPCIDPFLDDCDANGDDEVTLQEWGRCLGLEDDEIESECKPLKKD